MNTHGQRSEVLLIDPSGEPHPLPSRPFTEGIRGKSLEDALQWLIEEYPGVLPGAEMDPGGEDPPRFVLLRREMPVSQWSLDHLLVDQHGVLTLLEAKLTENREARRAVVGQIMDYAANAAEDWGRGEVRRLAADFWRNKGRELDEVLREDLGEEDIDAFWEKVEQNLEEGRIRLVVAGDQIRPEVRKVLEFLNKEMSNVEVYGLELSCYGSDEDGLVVVPRLLGQTQAAHARKGRTRRQSWTAEQLRSVVEEEQPEGRRFLQILNWAVESGSFRALGSKVPAFGVNGPSRKVVVSVYTGEEGVWCATSPDCFRDVHARDAFVRVMRQGALLAADLDPDSPKGGGPLSKRLGELTDEDMETLRIAMQDAIRSV